MKLSLGLMSAVLLLTMGPGIAQAADVPAKLRGAHEVPPVKSEANGTAAITIGADKSVSGKLTTVGIAGTAAHIHLGATGANGPAIVTLTKGSDNEWLVPAGARLTDEQYAAYKAGKLYVNVHSNAHKPGEIRTQLKP